MNAAMFWRSMRTSDICQSVEGRSTLKKGIENSANSAHREAGASTFAELDDGSQPRGKYVRIWGFAQRRVIPYSYGLFANPS
ncbi:hypothetical protein LF1_44190 [Rubripirellula obstinata]|uniref:Uncharacterized protein n=1 Tax=Rubripirellula obstinata TaxID=406547 RepID=A0A5B1CLB2_9BACT|nr:hypothetical protein LF1_44190 [Rubripirellula obstinata]